jgi:peptidoglycan hydrolase-like protein with peptidoglycan-binding domain
LDDLRYLQNLIERKDVRKRICHGSKDSVGVKSLQKLLNELGLGMQLNWAKYGADGQYGRGTIKALNAFAEKEGMATDGKALDPDLAQSLIAKFSGCLGKDWAKEKRPSKTATTIDNLSLREVTEKNRPRLYISDGVLEARFTRFKKGVRAAVTQRYLKNGIISAERGSFQPSLAGGGSTA